MDYSMYTAQGNRRVTSLMQHLVSGRKAGLTEAELLAQFLDEHIQIARQYPEITDTAVREAIEAALERNGFSGKFSGVMAHYHPKFDTMRQAPD